MKSLLLSSCAAIALMATPALAHDPYYEDHGWSYRGADYDVYSNWQPEFRNRAQRYRHNYYDDYYVSKRKYRRHGRRVHRDDDYEEEFWVGNCKVEREWDDGRYEEEIDCD